MVCHVTTTGCFRSLFGKHALHSRTASLRFGTAVWVSPRHGDTHMLAYRQWYPGCAIRLLHPQPHRVSDAVYLACYQMPSSVVSCARDTPRTRLTGAIPFPKVTRAHALSIFAIAHTPPLLWGVQLPWFLPGKRWSWLICFIAAASSEAGTTSSPVATAVRLPSRYCFFHLSQFRLQHMYSLSWIYVYWSLHSSKMLACFVYFLFVYYLFLISVGFLHRNEIGETIHFFIK